MQKMLGESAKACQQQIIPSDPIRFSARCEIRGIVVLGFLLFLAKTLLSRTVCHHLM
jgi:hypothetical protein